MVAKLKHAKSHARLKKQQFASIRARKNWREVFDLFYASRWFQYRLDVSTQHLIQKSRSSASWEEDIKQEALLIFAKALIRNPSLGFDKLKGAFGTYVAIIIFRCCQKVIRPFDDVENRTSKGESDDPIEEFLEQLEELLDLRDRIDQLKRPYRSVTRMICEGKSIDEVAQKRGQSRRTIYRWVERSNQLLRKAMN